MTFLNKTNFKNDWNLEGQGWADSSVDGADVEGRLRQVVDTHEALKLGPVNKIHTWLDIGIIITGKLLTII